MATSTKHRLKAFGEEWYSNWTSRQPALWLTVCVMYALLATVVAKTMMQVGMGTLQTGTVHAFMEVSDILVHLTLAFALGVVDLVITGGRAGWRRVRA